MEIIKLSKYLCQLPVIFNMASNFGDADEQTGKNVFKRNVRLVCIVFNV